MWGYKLIIDKLGINKFSITFEITRLHHLPLIWNISVIHWPDCIKIEFSNVSSCSNELCCPLAANCFSVTFKKVWPSATTNYIVLWPQQFVLLNYVNLLPPKTSEFYCRRYHGKLTDHGVLHKLYSLILSLQRYFSTSRYI